MAQLERERKNIVNKCLVIVLCILVLFSFSGCNNINGTNLKYTKIEYAEKFTDLAEESTCPTDIKEDIDDYYKLMIDAYNKSDKEDTSTLKISEELDAAFSQIKNYFDYYTETRKHSGMIEFLFPCVYTNNQVILIEAEAFLHSVGGKAPKAPEMFIELKESIEQAYESYKTGDMSNYDLSYFY